MSLSSALLRRVPYDESSSSLLFGFWDLLTVTTLGKTGDTLLFDAGSYFAHNEMELGHWRCEFSSHFRSPVYTRQYLESFPAAEPLEEFDDRNRLYSIKGAINYSAGHPRSHLRKT
jgi:protein-ribulosamine 3-kinase